MSLSKQGAFLMLMLKLKLLCGFTSEIGITDHADFEIPLKKIHIPPFLLILIHITIFVISYILCKIKYKNLTIFEK